MRSRLVIVRCGLLWVASTSSMVLLTVVVVLRLLLLLISRSTMMLSRLLLVASSSAAPRPLRLRSCWLLEVGGPCTAPRSLRLGVAGGHHTLLSSGLRHGHRGGCLRGAVHWPRRARGAHCDKDQ